MKIGKGTPCVVVDKKGYPMEWGFPVGTRVVVVMPHNLIEGIYLVNSGKEEYWYPESRLLPLTNDLTEEDVM